MPANEPIRGSARHWLFRARADLALARVPLPHGALYEDLCFHAQQAAEKALKAVYVERRWPFRYVHNLEELITGLRRRGLIVPEDVAEAVVLSHYAFETRYPGTSEPVTGQQHREAVALAARVVAWADKEIAEKST